MEEEISAREISNDVVSMEVYNCREQLFRVPTRTEYSKIDQDLISINITLFYKFIIRETVYSSLHDHATCDYTVSKLTYALYINLDKIEDLPGEQEEIKNLIGPSLNLFEEDAEELSMDIVKFAREFVGENAGGNNVFDLDLKVTLLHCYTLAPQNMWGEISNNVPYMVPATEESIRGLDQLKIEEDSDQNCVICMEDFLKGSEGVLMPCLHQFHGDCIEEWLNTSHYCPICRFEMPTDLVLGR